MQKKRIQKTAAQGSEGAKNKRLSREATAKGVLQGCENNTIGVLVIRIRFWSPLYYNPQHNDVSCCDVFRLPVSVPAGDGSGEASKGEPGLQDPVPRIAACDYLHLGMSV